MVPASAHRGGSHRFKRDDIVHELEFEDAALARDIRLCGIDKVKKRGSCIEALTASSLRVSGCCRVHPRIEEDEIFSCAIRALAAYAGSSALNRVASVS